MSLCQHARGSTTAAVCQVATFECNSEEHQDEEKEIVEVCGRGWVQSTDSTFGEKLRQQLKEHGCFGFDPRIPSLDFIVRHYAGDVLYSCDKFLDKNRDSLSPGARLAAPVYSLPLSLCLAHALPYFCIKCLRAGRAGVRH